jgi:WD40 repeat protein/predicted Ser/Thr protein kinase
MSQHIDRHIGEYHIVESIGSGGMGQVFKAYQPSFDRFVALKVLPEHMAEDPHYIERFEQEARIIAKLEHRHILPVYDFGHVGGVAYLAMRYLRGGTLKDLLIQSGGRVGMADAGRIITQMASALDYAHAQKIIHRDVKPSNILIDGRGDGYLMDFGIAKVMEATGHLTATGGALGTPAYMSPEQGMGKPVDGRTDVYALGIILYQLVVGRVPFEADTPYAVIIAHSREALPLPSALRPGLPESLERVILKALAKDREDRFGTCGAMSAALSEALGQAGPSEDASTPFLGLSEQLAAARPSDEVTRDVRIAARRKPGRRRNIGCMVLTGLAGLLIGAAIGIYQLLPLSARYYVPLISMLEPSPTVDSAVAIPLMRAATATQKALLALTPTAAPLESGRFQLHSQAITDIAFNPVTAASDWRMAAASQSGSIVITDSTGAVLLTIDSGGSAITTLAWSPDGTQVAAGSANGSVSLWNADTGERPAVNLVFHRQSITALAWSADGSQMVSGDQVGSIALWDMNTGERLITVQVEGAVVRLDWISSQQQVLIQAEVNKDYNRAILWNPSNNTQLQVDSPAGYVATSKLVIYSPDGRLIAAVGTYNNQFLVDGTTFGLTSLWNAASQEQVGLTHSTDDPLDLVFDSDSTLLAILTASEVRIVDCGDGQFRHALSAPEGISFTSAGWVPGSRMLAAGLTDGSVMLWQIP